LRRCLEDVYLLRLRLGALLDRDGQDAVLEAGGKRGRVGHFGQVGAHGVVRALEFGGDLAEAGRILELRLRLQGEGPVLKSAACAKHLAVHSGPEHLRHSFDAVVSNYVYHNIPGDRQAYLLETLRVLKKGGMFAIHDIFSKAKYGDMQAFVKKLTDMGYADVRLIDTTDGTWITKWESVWMELAGSALLIGIK